MSNHRHVVLTGIPGDGKTTLIKKVISALKVETEFVGFYTEEVCGGNSRIGFDVVSVSGQEERVKLARKNVAKNPRIGSYHVYVDEFETFFATLNFERGFLVLDEIGKMEMLSKKFVEKVAKIFFNSNSRIFCTIPLNSSAKLIRDIRDSKHSKLFEVTKENRDSLLVEIVKTVKESK